MADIINQAKDLISKKDYKNAIELLKGDSSAIAQGLLGECYYNISDLNNAQICLINSVMEEYNEDFIKILEHVLKEKEDKNALLGVCLLKLEKHPNDIFILRDITVLAKETKNYDIALEYYDILLEKCPDDYVAWNNRGLIYEELGEWEKAWECYQKTLKLKDFFSPNFNLGVLSRKMHRYQDSIKYLKKSVLQNPNSPQPKYALSMSYMMIKDFKNGYPLYANHMTKIMPFYYKHEWDGTPHPDKSVCIFTTGGLGDMIMYARYFEYLKENFKKIFILLPKTLHDIFQRSFPYLKIIDSSLYFFDYDYAITPMHILKFFNLNFNEFVPKTNGFLITDTNKDLSFKEKFFNHNKMKIAINWHGNREGTRTFFNRSMPIQKLEPVFEKMKDKAAFYSIQKDDSHTDCKKYPFIIDLHDYIKDFDDTASILKSMDILITIDSSPAHMAGAIGTKTFVILPYANEWRWFNEGKTTVWYDSLRLFRQNKEGNWDFAISEILKEL